MSVGAPDPVPSAKARADLLAGLLLAGIVAGYTLLSAFQYAPLQEGWFTYYSLLMRRGLFPYRDFYLHIPPAYLLLSHGIARVFGDAFAVMRTFGIVERTALVLLMYGFLRRRFGVVESFLGMVFGFFYYTAMDLDPPYSYYQTSLLTSALCAFPFYLAIEGPDGRPRPGRIALLFVSGLFAGLTLFNRQSVGPVLVVAPVAFLLLLAARRRSVLQALLLPGVYLGGALLTSACFVAWLFHNDALQPFLDIVLGGAASKGPLTDVLFAFLPRLVQRTGWTYTAILFSTALVLAGLLARGRCKATPAAPPDPASTKDLLFLALFVNAVAACFMVPWALEDAGRPFFAALDWYRQVPAAVQLTFVGTLGLCAGSFVAWFRAGDTQVPFLLFGSSFALIWIYGHGMSGFLEPHVLLWPFALGFAAFWEWSAGGRLNRWIRGSLVAVLLFQVSVISSERCAVPYYWWGWQEPPVWTADRQVDHPLLAGLSLSPPTAQVYAEVTSLVREHSTPDDEVFAFPHFTLFNLLAERFNQAFAPVCYFDVCSDATALKLVDYLKTHRPKLILLMEFPPEVWKTHEDTFRAGRPSGQREVVAQIGRFVDQGQYRVLRRFESPFHAPLVVIERAVP